MKVATKNTKKNQSYINLLKEFPPRLIASEDELYATQKVMYSLVDQGDLTEAEEDYLSVLGTLVHEYESQHHAIPDIYGVDLVKALMIELNLKQKDLVAIFKTESIVSDVLNEKRKLTTNHIQKLADFFHTSPASFFPRSNSRAN